MVVIGEKRLYSGNLVLFGQNWFYSSKVVFLGKIVVFGRSGRKFLYSGQSGCIRAMVVLGKSGCIRAKLVVFG